jgi:hypothetical protein
MANASLATCSLQHADQLLDEHSPVAVALIRMNLPQDLADADVVIPTLVGSHFHPSDAHFDTLSDRVLSAAEAILIELAESAG